MYVVESIQSLYLADTESDKRDPVVSFQLSDYGTIGLLAPDPTWWLRMAVLLPFLAFLNAVTAIAIYFCIVKNRGSTSSYLIGYGVIGPFMLVVPLRASLYLGLRNTAQVVGFGASLCIVIFRMLMAMHGTLPPFVERDLLTFVLFFVSPLQFDFDSKTGKVVPCTTQDFIRNSTGTLMSMILLSLCLGLMIHVDFELFLRRPVTTFWDLFYWRNILNNYAMAYLTGRCVEAGTLMVGVLTELVTGKTVIKVSNNPLTQSTSPSDFWGRRWNDLVHIVLKGGVYIPLRRNGFSKGVAALVTFTASGLFHEYILIAVMMMESLDYTPNFGSQLVFFAWNGTVLALEGVFSGHPAIQWMSKNLPKPIITALVLLTVLPISHFFVDEYLAMDFFHHFAVGMPTVVWYPSTVLN